MEVRIIRENGSPVISMDGRKYTPLAFRSMRPQAETIRQFYNAGIRLMSILHSGMNSTLNVPYSLFGEIWTGIGQYDFDALDKQMEFFISNAPEACFNIVLMLDTRKWYLEQNPEFRNSFRYIADVAGSPKWRKDVSDYLTDVIGYIEKKYDNKKDNEQNQYGRWPQ